MQDQLMDHVEREDINHRVHFSDAEGSDGRDHGDVVPRNKVHKQIYPLWFFYSVVILVIFGSWLGASTTKTNKDLSICTF
jgi:hypothetical protein